MNIKKESDMMLASFLLPLVLVTLAHIFFIGENFLVHLFIFLLYCTTVFANAYFHASKKDMVKEYRTY